MLEPTSGAIRRRRDGLPFGFVPMQATEFSGVDSPDFDFAKGCHPLFCRVKNVFDGSCNDIDPISPYPGESDVGGSIDFRPIARVLSIGKNGRRFRLGRVVERITRVSLVPDDEIGDKISRPCRRIRSWDDEFGSSSVLIGVIREVTIEHFVRIVPAVEPRFSSCALPVAEENGTI